MKQELCMLEKLQHPHIVRVLDLLEDSKKIYIVAELCKNGNMLDMLSKVSKPENHIKFTESDAASLIKQILLALNHIHTQGIAHRDLKLENVMIDLDPYAATNESQFVAKLTDFGFACFMTPNKQEIKLGTPLYMAPEIIEGNKYGTKCDLFSLGVLCCMLLTGKQPFKGASRKEIYLSILEDAPDIHYLSRYYNQGSLVSDFVLKCLQKDP